MKFWSKKIAIILFEFQFKSVHLLMLDLLVYLLLFSVSTFSTVAHSLLSQHCS